MELKDKIYEIISTVYYLGLERDCENENDFKVKEIATDQIMELIKEEK